MYLILKVESIKSRLNRCGNTGPSKQGQHALSCIQIQLLQIDVMISGFCACMLCGGGVVDECSLGHPSETSIICPQFIISCYFL